MRDGAGSFRPRRGIRRPYVVITTALLVVVVVVLTTTIGPLGRSPNNSSSVVVARAIDPNGPAGIDVTYSLGQELLLSVTVQNSTSPVSLHQVFANHAYGELTWNVTSTHYTYVIDSGPADPADVGVNHVYAVVTFADGHTARSNNVTMTVIG
jgi:hypothetical protein